MFYIVSNEKLKNKTSDMNIVTSTENCTCLSDVEENKHNIYVFVDSNIEDKCIYDILKTQFNLPNNAIGFNLSIGDACEIVTKLLDDKVLYICRKACDNSNDNFIYLSTEMMLTKELLLENASSLEERDSLLEFWKKIEHIVYTGNIL